MATVNSSEWLVACRSAVNEVRTLLESTHSIAERAIETGTRGEGGDRTLVIDAAAEDVIFTQLEGLRARGLAFTAVSEERGEVDFGGGPLRVVIDPIDGSLNAKRGLPHHALSIAVADGPEMADVRFGYVYDFGPAEEWWAVSGQGAFLNGQRLDRSVGERRGITGKLEVLGIESADPRWVAAAADGLESAAYRLRAMGTIASALCQVAAGRLDALVSLRACRAVDAAAGQLIVREGGGVAIFPAFDPPLAAPLDVVAHSQVVAARTEDTASELARIGIVGGRVVSDIVDWVLTEWIARRVSGLGAGPADDGALGEIDLAELATDAEARVVAYTGLTPSAPLPAPEGVDRPDWVAANLSSMRKLMEPMLSKAGEGLGPLKPMAQLAVGFTVSGEVGLLVGYMAQRVLGQYELVLLEELDPPPPRLLFVLPNLNKAVANFKADKREFLTWVTLHEVTHAVQFSGVPWLQGHLSGLLREIMASAEVRLDTERRFRLPSRAQLRRIMGALRRGDLIGVVTNDAERETIDRVQAVMSVIEGHAEHVMDAVAPALLPSLPHLRQSLDERRANQSLPSRIIGRLLGLELKLKQYERGKIFCDAVVAAAGPDALTQVFSAPEALPSLAEIEDPPAWLTRMGLVRPPELLA